MPKKENKLTDARGEPLDACGAIYKNDKFYCAECGVELTVDRDCPSCYRQIDWERAIINYRRGNPTIIQ